MTYAPAMAPGRSRSAARTRSALLAAATSRFGAQGYERTTLRQVAADVGVDAAMVHRYFGSKETLFAEAVDFDLHLPDLGLVDPEDLAATIMRRFFAVWEDDGTFIALVRAATTNPAATAAVHALLAEQVAPALAAVTPDRTEQRAALFASQIVGLAVARYVLRLAPLALMSHEELTAWVGPTLRHYLIGALEPPR